MRHPFRLLKLSLVLLVMLASASRPVIVYAHNGQNNSVSIAAHAHSHKINHAVLSRYSPISKTMRVLDKEKVETVCIAPAIQKASFSMGRSSFEKTTPAAVASLSFQTPILRI